MKSKTLLLVTLSLLTLFSACGRKSLLHEERQFDRNVWNRFTPEVFDIHVTNVENYYNLDFTVAVDTTVYRYDRVPLMLILNGPDGERRQFHGVVLLKDKERWRGEIVDGYRVANGRIRSYFSFNRKGDYRLEVSQETSQYDLEGIHSLTADVTKAKLDYNL